MTWYTLTLYDKDGHGWPYLWSTYDRDEANAEAERVRAKPPAGLARVEVTERTS